MMGHVLSRHDSAGQQLSITAPAGNVRCSDVCRDVARSKCHAKVPAFYSFLNLLNGILQEWEFAKIEKILPSAGAMS